MPPTSATVTTRPHATPHAHTTDRAAAAPRDTTPRSALLPTVLGLALAAGLAGNALAQSPSFSIIPRLPGRFGDLEVTGVSADGRVVSGFSLYPGAFTWTAETGRVDIAGSGGVPNNARAYAISGDGTTVTGSFPLGNGFSAFRYRGPGTYEALDLSFGGRTDCKATGVSGDGSVIVGSAADANFNSYAIRWTPQTGARVLLGGGGYHEEATHVSRDGSTTLGFAIANGSGGSETYTVVWRNGTMGARLVLPDGYDEGGATALNFDGSILVGGGLRAGTTHLLMWRNGTPIDLGASPGFETVGGQGVDDAGDVALFQLINGGTASVPYVWTPARGIERLAEYLQANGVQIPSGSLLTYATGLSADGRTIAGAMYLQGQGPYGFVATIPTPGAAGVAAALGIMRTARRRRVT